MRVRLGNCERLGRFHHSGGVNCARVDSSVVFVSDTIDTNGSTSNCVTSGKSPFGVWGAGTVAVDANFRWRDVKATDKEETKKIVERKKTPPKNSTVEIDDETNEAGKK